MLLLIFFSEAGGRESKDFEFVLLILWSMNFAFTEATVSNYSLQDLQATISNYSAPSYSLSSAVELEGDLEPSQNYFTSSLPFW